MKSGRVSAAIQRGAGDHKRDCFLGAGREETKMVYCPLEKVWTATWEAWMAQGDQHVSLGVKRGVTTKGQVLSGKAYIELQWVA
jgi:hypothetical protein